MKALPSGFRTASKAAASFAVLFLLASCMGEMKAMRADIENQKYTSYETQRKLSEMEAAIAAQGEEAKRIKESLEPLRDGQASLQSQVSEMLAEVQSLNGRLDEQMRALEKSDRGLGAEIEVLRARVDELSAPEKAAELDSRLSAVEADVAGLKGRIAAAEETARAPAPAVEERPTSPPTPDGMYEEAYAAFKEKRYKEARQKMKDFLSAHPDHSLAGNAAFWVGETHFNERAYEDAILAYEDVIQKYKDSPKVPSAMLKQAYSFIELGDKKAAKAILNDLVKRFPKDEAAKAAKNKLKALE